MGHIEPNALINAKKKLFPWKISFEVIPQVNEDVPPPHNEDVGKAVERVHSNKRKATGPNMISYQV